MVLTIDKERVVHVFSINQKQGKASLKSKNFERVLCYSSIFQHLMLVVAGKHSISTKAGKAKSYQLHCSPNTQLSATTFSILLSA